MPIYEYKCKNCDDVFEEFQSMGASSESVKCPKCGSTNVLPLEPIRRGKAGNTTPYLVGGQG